LSGRSTSPLFQLDLDLALRRPMSLDCIGIADSRELSV
jgi:hypothetical protein